MSGELVKLQPARAKAYGFDPAEVYRVVRTYTRPGYISHVYSDHVSILKFIERNWGLPPISLRSRDNLPNPVADTDDNPYVPVNSPAIGDLFDLFDFGSDVQ